VSDFHENQDKSNEVGLEFALTDIDVALTFMDVAEVSANEETISRNHDNARKAYATVVDFLKKLHPDERQSEVIEAKLALLKARLDAIKE
jgi:hypothetical protein